MEVKINLEKLVKSLLQYAEDNCEETMLDYLNSALQYQGLEYKYGEIAETPQESEDEKVKKFIIEQLFKIRKTIVYNSNLDRELANAIAWLEKQGKQKFMKPNAIGDINTYSDRGEVICPYCGFINDREYFCFPDELEFDKLICECKHCGREFYLCQDITINNETFKLEEI